MKRTLSAWPLLAVLAAGMVWAAGPSLEPGSPAPVLTMTAPADQMGRRYLGLAEGQKEFLLTQVKAKVVLLEIMNAYCPYCQREAPNVNRLYAAIQADPALKDQIKMVALAASNDDFELGVFRDKFQVGFPMVADPHIKIAEVVGEVRTPHFLAVRLEKGGGGVIILNRQGPLGEVAEVLAALRKDGGL